MKDIWEESDEDGKVRFAIIQTVTFKISRGLKFLHLKKINLTDILKIVWGYHTYICGARKLSRYISPRLQKTYL